MRLWWVRACVCVSVCVRERGEQEKVRETQRWSMKSLFGGGCVSVSLPLSPWNYMYRCVGPCLHTYEGFREK